jgi:predicted Zn finger-like uncharacterized protein
MFTTCPNCRMNLAVTATDLRIGQGYVRCGRCERVFNALLALAENLDQDQQSGLAATGTTSVPALEDTAQPAPTESAAVRKPPPDELPAFAAELEQSLPDPVPLPPLADQDEGAEWARITPIHSTPAQGAAADRDLDLVESQPTGTFETIVLEGDTYLQTEEHVDEDEVDEQLQAIARQISDRNATEPSASDELSVEELTGENVVLGDDPPPEVDADIAVGNRPRQHWAWSAGAGVLLLVLLGQVVHQNRQSLVAHPWFERPLPGIYALFGTRLEPRWDLKAYDLRQLGGEAMPGTASTIVLRASVHNRARNAQPPPMIRAVLQDRFGNALSTSAIAPQDYLRGDTPSRMAPDQRLDAELRLEDPNRQAVGFELDACLPGADGRLHCSNDP